MKVSVALATYNGEKYLDKQLSSIVNQLRLPDEIVITDDSTTDGTHDIIIDYINKYPNISFKYIKNDKRLGFCHNFFKAIQNTTGGIIFLSDQDDIWDIAKIEEMAKCIEDNDDIKLLCCKYVCIDENEKVISSVHEYSTSLSYFLQSKILNKKLFKMDYEEVFKILTFPGMSFAISKDLKGDLSRFLDVVNHKDIVFHDVVLSYLASIKNGFYIYNKKFVNYRMHGDNSIGINLYNGKGKTDRAVWLDEIIGNQKAIATYENAYNKNPIISKYIDKLIDFNFNRQNSLKSKKTMLTIANIFKFKYCLSMKAYVGDLLYILLRR